MADPHKIAQAAQPAKSVREKFAEYLMDEKRLPSIGRELAYAVADIRQKIVEEAAFGRAVTPDFEARDRGPTVHQCGDKTDGKTDPLGRSTPVVAEPESHGHER